MAYVRIVKVHLKEPTMQIDSTIRNALSTVPIGMKDSMCVSVKGEPAKPGL